MLVDASQLRVFYLKLKLCTIQWGLGIAMFNATWQLNLHFDFSTKRLLLG